MLSKRQRMTASAGSGKHLPYPSPGGGGGGRITMSDQGGVIFNLHRAPHPVSHFTSFNLSRPSPSRGGWNEHPAELFNFQTAKRPRSRSTVRPSYARITPENRGRRECRV